MKVTMTFTDLPNGSLDFTSMLEGDLSEAGGQPTPSMNMAALIQVLGTHGVLGAISELGSASAVLAAVNQQREAAGVPVTTPKQLSASDTVKALLLMGFFDRIAPVMGDYLAYKQLVDDVVNGRADEVASAFFSTTPPEVTPEPAEV